MATRESSSKIKYFSSKASGRLLRERTVVRRLMGLEMEFIINYMKIKRYLLIGRKAMTNLDSILKSRDITLPTKICLVKAMVFPVVMYGCESLTIKKAAAAAATAKLLQSCPTLCDPIDGSPPGSSSQRKLSTD